MKMIISSNDKYLDYIKSVSADCRLADEFVFNPTLIRKYYIDTDDFIKVYHDLRTKLAKLEVILKGGIINENLLKKHLNEVNILREDLINHIRKIKSNLKQLNVIKKKDNQLQ